MSSMSTAFEDLFSRNVGILSTEELYLLRESKVALAGVGGVGGVQLVSMARTGISHFSIADPELFQPPDINRQYGASLPTLGLKKVEVMKDIVLNINPEATLDILPQGITRGNIDHFLEDADIVIDSIEYSALEEKIALAQRAREKNLFLITSPTWGYGASLVVFSPKGTSFEKFFGIDTDEDLLTRAKRYADRLFPLKPVYLDPYPYGDDMLEGKKPASVFCLGTFLSAALVTTEIVSILLQKREPVTAPKVVQVDLFRRSYNVADLSKETG